MSYHRCSRCASDQMMDGGFVADAAGVRIVVGVDRHPDRGPLSHPATTGVHVSVCGACGFIEFWANQPGELYQSYRAAELRGAGSPPPRS